MSSYLNIYLKTRKKENVDSKYILFLTYSRNSEIYQRVNEAGNFYSANGTKTQLTTDILSNIIDEVNRELVDSKDTLNTYREFKSTDIESILSLKKYIKDLTITIHKLSVLLDIAYECSYEYTDCEGLYCFID